MSNYPEGRESIPAYQHRVRQETRDLQMRIISLKPGEAIEFTRDDLQEMAKGEVRSFLFDSVRPEDRAETLRKFREIHGLVVEENPAKASYTARRPNVAPPRVREVVDDREEA